MVEKLKDGLRYGVGVLAEVLGYVVIALIFLYGACTLYVNSRYGEEFRALTSAAWDGHEVEVREQRRK